MPNHRRRPGSGSQGTLQEIDVKANSFELLSVESRKGIMLQKHWFYIKHKIGAFKQAELGQYRNYKDS